MHVERHSTATAEGLRIGIAVSRYHHEVTDALCRGAVEAFVAAGGGQGDLLVVTAPGAFELTILARALAAQADMDGVVALGCVIRGETTHDQHICQAVAQGLTAIAADTGKPVAFGLLTCQTSHQARQRAGGERGNKGEEAMNAVIETIRSLEEIAARKPGGSKA